REIQRRATLRRPVVDDEVPAIAQGDGIDAGVWIRQGCEGERRPRKAGIPRPSLEHALLPRAPDGLKHAARVDEDARLNRIDAAAIGGGRWEHRSPRQA